MQKSRSTKTMMGLEGIERKIDRARTEMFDLATKYGMCHELTIAKSQELDVFIIEHIKQKETLTHG
ncbi:MAG: aspartyl-phosphate phosphatase Spo0E family protein [Turicibacter sp.]|nr:aspartyl-phosphate phosphatase Spo0E family protein [Turicibacter sp.]